MRMPNSSKCQRWSSQWRGWSPAMFKKNQGMLCFFGSGKVKVVEEEVFLLKMWWSWQFASYIREHRNPYPSRCRYSLRFSNVRNQNKRHPQLGSMFLNVFFDASQQKEENTTAAPPISKCCLAAALRASREIQHRRSGPKSRGFSLVEVPGNKSACQKVRKTIIFTPRKKSEARCFKEGSVDWSEKSSEVNAANLDLQSPHLAQHSQTSTKVSLIAKPDSKLKTKLIAATWSFFHAQWQNWPLAHARTSRSNREPW